MPSISFTDRIRIALATKQAGWDNPPARAGISTVPWWPTEHTGPTRPASNAIVEALLNVKSRSVNELAPSVWWTPDDPEDEPQPHHGHPLNLLLDRPNSMMDWSDINDYAVAAIDLAGTGFLAKLRATPGGPVVALWPLYPEYVTPLSSAERWLAAWRYQPPGGERLELDPSEVVVLRSGLNRTDHRLGRSALAAALREVLTDDEAARYTSAILHNLGVPGVVLTVRDNAPEPTPEQAAAVRSQWATQFGGDRRGGVLITRTYDVHPVSINPRDMDLAAIRHVPEERIAGVLGIPAIMASLGSGLAHATYANVDGLREFMTEETIVSWWRVNGRQLTRGLVEPGEAVQIGYPISLARALQEDRNSESVRVGDLYTRGLIGLGEARAQLGYDDAAPTDLHPMIGEAGSGIPGDGDGDGVVGEGDRKSVGRALPPILKQSGFDEARWESEWEDAVGDILAGWAARFAADAGLATTTDQLEAIADAAINPDELEGAFRRLGVAMVMDLAYGPDILPTKAATLNPDDVAAGMSRFADQHATRAVAGISEWTRIRVRNVITRGMAAGDSLEQITSDVNRWIGDPARAATIARTEVTALRWAAADFAAAADPRPMWKTWLIGASDPRDTHGEANGQRVLDFEYFTVGGWPLRHPGDPSGPAEEIVNCRCRMVFNLATRVVPEGRFGR